MFIPHLYLVPPQGVTPHNFANMFDLIKLEWLGYRAVKNCDDKLSRFDTIRERDGQMYEQTDRQNSYIIVAHQHCCAVVRQKGVVLLTCSAVRSILLSLTCPARRHLASGEVLFLFACASMFISLLVRLRGNGYICRGESRETFRIDRQRLV